MSIDSCLHSLFGALNRHADIFDAVERNAMYTASLDFNRPESAPVRGAYLAFLTIFGSSLGLVLHGDPDTYRYIPASIRRYPGARGVSDLMRAAGFADVRHVRVLGGLMAIHVAIK
jgi:demethylmenaquinone methyltransferase/2-methoxy-6-polyprenyl-1,4-benzoquinol methylase